ncbi:uncharacterized protein LOC107046094 [Diachasma alloeum]|uniref:uncharacterized protein LOC107046094 n=1 Tax=Diachasma alloeum TaxID=454923 RepID=UPI00073816BB|nr:uncharacterized protein LOC107046094 [Diachasma alloeum]
MSTRRSNARWATIGGAFKRLKSLEEARTKARPSFINPVQSSPAPPTLRLQTDFETTAKDSDLEDPNTMQSARDVRKAVRRKRSKGSPAAEAQTLKKLKQQNLTSKAAPQTAVTSDPPAKPEWTQVKTKKEKKRQAGQLHPQLPPRKMKEKKKQERATRKSVMRPEALIIRPKDKEKYSDILRRVQKDAPSEDAVGCVYKIRRTATGDMLTILSRKTTDGAPKLHTAIVNLLGDEAEVLSKGPQEDLEIKDLNETTSKEEVIEALKVAAGEENAIQADTIKALRKAYGGTQTASVRLTATTAKKILGDHGKIKIGWVNCGVRKVERPLKCFKCWHYGHLATKCKNGVDRSKICIKFAEPGHTVAACQKEPNCALCTEKGNMKNCTHIAGSTRCPVYQEALEKLNNKRR